MYKKALPIAVGIAALAIYFNPVASDLAAVPAAPPAKPIYLTDIYGVQSPVCTGKTGNHVQMLPQEHQYFTDNKEELISYEDDEFDPRGPYVYYDYQEMLKLQPDYRAFKLYTACAKYTVGNADPLLRVGSSVWQDFNNQAECVALLRMRDERKFSHEQISRAIYTEAGQPNTYSYYGRVAQLDKCFKAPN